MNVSNKTRVVNFNLFILAFIFCFLFMFICSNIIKGLLNSAIPDWFFVFLASIVLVLVSLMIKTQMVFELENSGEVITIRNYRWYRARRKKRVAPVFEVPINKIYKMKVHHMFYKKYLKIYFEGNLGITRKVKIDITGCSVQDIKNLNL